MKTWLEFFGLWLADFYLAATIVLAISALLFAVLRQPAPRMAVAWGSLIGLLIASGLCLAPSRPRLDLRPYFTRPETRVVESQPVKAPVALLPVVETPPPRAEGGEPVIDPFEPPQALAEQSTQAEAQPIEPVTLEPVPAAAEWLAVWGPRCVAFAVGSFLAGGLAMASWLMIGVVRASRLVRRSAPASVTCCEELRKIAGSAARLPRLRINSRLAMPVATGTLRPAILLPEGFAATGPRNALKAVLAHEWTHIKNGDLWLLAFDRVILTLLWAHPLYWWTRRRIRTNQELLADAAAASQIGPADYAALLVEWARQLAAHRGLTALTAVGIWERPAALEQRVMEILNHNHAAEPCSGRIRATLLVCLAGLGLIATLLSLRPPRAESALVSSSGSVSRTAPIALAEAPGDSPKIVDNHVGKDEIAGLCVGRGEMRHPGVEVALYIATFAPHGLRKFDLLGRTTTNDRGQFLFTHVRPLDSGETRRDQRYVIVARRKGLASDVSEVNHSHDWLDLNMPDAVPLRGTVKDEQGKPVVGALVRCNGNAWRSLSEGIHSARTDTQGQFQIDDVASLWGCIIEHPDFPAKVLYDESTYFQPLKGSRFPSDVIKLPLDVTLVKGSVVEGQVIDSVSHRPGAGLSLTIRGILGPYIARRIAFAQDPCNFFAETQTDKDGHYRFTRLPAGHFDVWLTTEAPDRASIGVHSLEVPAAKTVHVSDIRLVQGGIIHGKLIDDQSGQSISLGDGERVTIAVDGPARPQRQDEPQSFAVRHDGTFELRLPPGKNTLRLSCGPYFAEKPADRNAYYDVREIEIKEGQESTVDFRLVRLVPKREKGSAIAPSSSHTADANAARPEWFNVRAADLGGTLYDAAGHPIAGARVTLVSTDADGSKRKELKATTTNSWGQFIFACAPCQAGPKQHYELILNRDGEAPEVRKSVDRGKWLELKASPKKVDKGDARFAIREARAASTITFVSETKAPASAEDKSSVRNPIGRFSGTVRLDVAAKDLDGHESNRDESLKINRTVDNGIANVFVYLPKSPDGRPFAAPPIVFNLRTDGKSFSPRAGILRVGQELTLHNDGPPFANFHLFPSRNPEINHAVPPGGQGNPKVRMAVPESVPFEVRNDRDSQMRATILVLDHPFVAVTDELGAFEIPDLPPGKYTFRIWHERSGFLERALPIEIKPGETTKARLSYKLDRFER
jgi:protocatechuate 3,4-dioxygenase beta subunit/Zn-dependent protease with chaperone function